MAPKKKDGNKRAKEKLVGVSKRQSRRLFTYKDEDLMNAIESIKNKSMGFREACRFYGVPYATVHDRLSGKVAATKKPKVGPDPVLGINNEEKLSKWIIDMAKCGFPINKTELLESVAKIIAESGAKTPFKDGKPGETWYQKFLKRHPEISIREPEGINNARAAITESRIKQWFKELQQYVQSIGAVDIFEDPDRIFNGDESGFALCPKNGKVLGPKGFKNVYVKKNNDKENLTVLLVFAASGKLCPPLVIFPYIRPPKTLVDNMPKTWVLGRSESGWMKSDVFFEYISNDFNAWLAKNEVKKPVILFIDGHKSHMTYALSDFCQANGIILYALPPNSTHMLQPADVSVFRPLKQNWKTTVKQWQSENVNHVVTKLNFCSVLDKTISRTQLEEPIKNGFRKCGLYPLNEDAVDYTKCVKDTQDRVGRERREKRSSGNQKTTANAKEFDAAMKVISIIKTDLAKRHIDSAPIIEEIETAKARYLENRCSKTPRNSSTQSTSILNLDNSQLTLYGDDFPQPGSYVSLNDISVMALDEMEICSDQCYTVTVSADVHNDIIQNNTLAVSTDVHIQRDILAVSADVHNNIIQSDILAVSADDHNNIQNNTIAVSADAHNNLQNDTLAVSADSHNNLRNDTLAVSADAHNILQNDTILAIRNDVETEQVLSFDDVFEKHLLFPSPTSTPSKEKKRNGPKLPSAISSDAWREHYKKKEEEKENLDLEKKRRKELRAEEKEKKAKEKQKRYKNKKTLLKDTPKKHTEKCSEYCEELISDIEDDAEKNIGCDNCIRWFHLKCTEMRNKRYVEAAASSYKCSFCPNTQIDEQ